jgi:hypothetical protein
MIERRDDATRLILRARHPPQATRRFRPVHPLLHAVHPCARSSRSSAASSGSCCAARSASALGLALSNALGLDGLSGALVTLFVAMLVATLAWALLTALLRRFGLIR